MSDERFQIALERYKFIVIRWVTKELINEFAILPEMDCSLHSGFMSDEIVFRLRQDILGQQLDRIEVRYPMDWWQAFKERWFPGWMLKRWPVIEEIKIIDVKALYPKLTVPGHNPIINVWQSDYRTNFESD